MTTAVFVVAAALSSSFAGRWDLSVGESGGWLEISGSELRVVPRVGGVKTISSYQLDGDNLSFSNTEWFGRWERVNYKLAFLDGAIAGTATRQSGPVMPVSGVRAPRLARSVCSWGRPIKLSDDLRHWNVLSLTKPGNWTVQDGVLQNARSGPNLRTIDVFQDFRLDLQFRCEQGSNSGIFLRGRYELQIEEEPDNNDSLGRTGSIYRFIAPDRPVPHKGGEWRTLSLELVGRTVTVFLDGVKVIDSREIPGPTGGSFNSREEEPGPIILQGDHGAISYRNVVLTPGVQ